MKAIVPSTAKDALIKHLNKAIKAEEAKIEEAEEKIASLDKQLDIVQSIK